MKNILLLIILTILFPGCSKGNDNDDETIVYPPEDYTYKTVIVQRNEVNFNSIRETISSLTPDYYNRYIVFVPKGRWFECDLTGKEYVEIVGENMIETVLYVDGLSTKISPSDYSFPLHSDKPLNQIPQDLKHVFNARQNMSVRNLSVEANDAKYSLHLDSRDYTEASFKNCRLSILSGVNYPVGIGASSGQLLEFIDCEFIRSSTTGLGVFFHNWNNQNSPVRLHIENSKFINCGFILVDELGSDQNDQVNLINCHSDTGGEIAWMVDYKSDTQTTYWVNPSTGSSEPNPQNVPYCIKLNVSGSNVGSVYSHKFPYGDLWVSRPDALTTMITDYY